MKYHGKVIALIFLALYALRPYLTYMSCMYEGSTIDGQYDYIFVRPAFAQTSGSTLLEQEAGMSIYMKADVTPDLPKSKAVYKIIEKETSEYIVGSLSLPDLPENDDVHCFVHKDGWIVVYYLKTDPISKIIDWKYYVNGRITKTKLQLGLEKMVFALELAMTEIKYYHFQYFNADKWMIIIESGEASTESFRIKIPQGLISYEISWSHYGAISYVWEYIRHDFPATFQIDNDIISSIWEGYTTKYGLLTNLTPDVFHNVSTSSYSNVHHVAIVLAYQESYGSHIIIEYADSVSVNDLVRPQTPLTSPPKTSISLDGILGRDNWFTSDVKVNFSANIPIERTIYSLDNVTWINYTTPFLVKNEGYNHIYFRSIDKAGNAEQIREEIIKIDKTPPTGSVQINRGALYTGSRTVTLTLDATDAASGVSQVRFAKNGNWTEWEPYITQRIWNLSLTGQELPVYLQCQNVTLTIHVQFMDNAGLVSNASDNIIFMLKVPPSATLSNPNITSAADYYSVFLTWSENTDPDFLCYQIISSREPLNPSTGYVDEWFFHEMRGGLIYERSTTSYNFQIPTSFTKYYFLIRTYNKQWIFSDSNVVIVERTGSSLGPLTLPYFQWSLETILITISGIFGISVASFITYRMYKKQKIERFGIKYAKTKIKQYPWVDLSIGGIAGLILILLCIHLCYYLPTLGFFALCGCNLIINSILFNILIFKKATITRRLTAITLYILYFSFIVFTFYMLSSGTAIKDPTFIAFAIAVFTPVINTLACLLLLGRQLYDLIHFAVSVTPSNYPILYAVITSPLYLLPLTFYISQKLHQRYNVSRAKLISKLIEKAEKYYREGKPINAAKNYAKALLIGLKVNYEYIGGLADWYIYLIRKIVYNAAFSSKEEEKKNLNAAVRLQEAIKNKKLLSKSAKTREISDMDILLDKAQKGELDYIVDAALKDKDFVMPFLEKISVYEMEISELANKSGYTTEAIKKLLQKCIEEKMVEGYLTLDQKKFISRTRLRSILRETLE